ncbi:WRKY transcription factor 22 [Apostasia shenzhenica]|uniref:WRKY transcription factor 22 n=1 Tax=Apostasia shenzhenica TaxID=1088818 RepID=A0A2I0AU29_9ASPA|nr:WRKY transcription factor 22 [Apostasia shenzhenica]
MENDDDGWDLYAVVRSCRTASRREDPPELEKSHALPFRIPDLPPSGDGDCELDKLSKPCFSVTCFPNQTSPLTFSSSAATATVAVASTANTPVLRKATRQISHHTPRSKRRKTQQKRVVCQIPADGLAADMWAWRKYGQKPIKGSPYPRGYYRCSSSKDCLARKQVERSRTDPAMFVITYSADHNHPMPTHRNSLAGSTRQKFPAAATPSISSAVVAGEEQGNPSTSSPSTASGGEEEDDEEDVDEEEEDEEGMLLVEDMEVLGEDEVLFMGLERQHETPAPSGAAVADADADAIAAFFGGSCGGGFDDHFLRR